MFAPVYLAPHETETPWLNGFHDDAGNFYGATDQGNVRFGDLALRHLGGQSQYESRYVDGILPGYPALGVDLSIEGGSDDYHGLGIQPEDAPELIARIVAYKALTRHSVVEDGKTRTIREDEIQEFTDYLRNRSLPVPEDLR